MRTLSGQWIEWFATLMLGVTAVFSFSYEQYATAMLAAACCGLVAGVQLGVWAGRR